ncbi:MULTISPECIES: hypothetical protein [unclassified Cupriavidus]|nr:MULTISPECIES: hypothetical protein [unclassified Cupriavidus]
MKSRLFPISILSIAAVVAIGLAGAGVYRMWAQAIAPVHHATQEHNQ